MVALDKFLDKAHDMRCAAWEIIAAVQAAGGYLAMHFLRLQPPEELGGVLRIHADKDNKEQDFSLLLRRGPNGGGSLTLYARISARCLLPVDLHACLLRMALGMSTDDIVRVIMHHQVDPAACIAAMTAGSAQDSVGSQHCPGGSNVHEAGGGRRRGTKQT